MNANATLDVVNIDLSKAKAVGVMSREDLIDMLRTGEIVVIDKATGQFLNELYGVPLPSPAEVIETVIKMGTSKIM